jgi:hypothetical protein
VRFSFEVESRNQRLHVKVFDEEARGADKPVGQIELAITADAIAAGAPARHLCPVTPWITVASQRRELLI